MWEFGSPFLGFFIMCYAIETLGIKKNKSTKVTEISSGVGLQIHLELALNSL